MTGLLYTFIIINFLIKDSFLGILILVSKLSSKKYEITTDPARIE